MKEIKAAKAKATKAAKGARVTNETQSTPRKSTKKQACKATPLPSNEDDDSIEALALDTTMMSIKDGKHTSYFGRIDTNIKTWFIL